MAIRPARHLPAETKKLWKKEIKNLEEVGVELKAADSLLFEQYLGAYEQSVKLQQALATEGDTILMTNGCLQTNPTFNQLKSVRADMVRIGKALCITGDSRRARKIAPKEEDDIEDFDDFR